MKITNDILYVGVNDHDIDLFEGHYIVPDGMAYNSYVVKGEKTAVMDSVDAHFTDEWIGKVREAKGAPDYLVIQHMEPDHSGSIMGFMNAFPDAKIVSSQKAFTMIANFFEGEDFADRRVVVKEGDTLDLGGHVLNFIAAPMVHWPEVIMTYDATDKVLFSADGFGRFGALDVIGETSEEDDDWACEARRYYFGIVGKFGTSVQALLKKIGGLGIKKICPLHGPVLDENIEYYVGTYGIWSSYGVESEGAAIFYTSVYGNTKKAAEKLAEILKEKGCPKIALNDLAREDIYECVEDAFRYGKIVLATTTYNGGVFPKMKEFINLLTERNYQNRSVALIENGSWAPVAAKGMASMLEGCRDIRFTDTTVTIRSALNEDSEAQIDSLAKELI